MCMCTKWLVKPPTGKGRQRYFNTESEAKTYAAQHPGATIKAPTKKARVR